VSRDDAPRALPTGTVTFLFTDLEGSTRLWEEHPEAMQGALARHDEILRDAIESHSGHVVKTTGDGVHAAFATAHDAAEAAIAGQLALGSEPWAVTGPLRVRMGIHTGEASVRDGDYYGTALNRAARLMAAAHGGQIVVSRATEELVRDNLDPAVSLLDLGEHRLRDLSRPERVFQVSYGDESASFAPLKSVDSYPGNLPVQLTTFVGRDDELVAVSKTLEDTRMVTLTGVGGVGKTRLAVQIAADLLPEYEDGVWLFELAAVTDSDAMLDVVATTLSLQPRPGATLDEVIVDVLRTKRMVLVLDNCEHLLDAAGMLAEKILVACPDVRVIATSREGFAVAGEQVWPLRSLPLPAAGAPVEQLAVSDAVRLFEDRARAARREFCIDAGNAEAVAEICRRLDGIPLAIELAAARVVSMSPTEIARRLDERFRLLTGGRRTAVERHQTLRATVDWSYSLLDDTDRTVFNRLGVFAGTFDSAAAEAVATTDGVETWDVVDALADLVAKSMIVAEEGATGSTRYQMLETLRHYAREQLDHRGETDGFRRRHAEHYADLAEHIGPAVRSPDELLWRDRLAEELDNIRMAVTWALDAEDDADCELALRIIAALAYQDQFDPTLGIGGWARRAVDRVESTTPGRRHAVLAAAGYAATRSGLPDEGRALAESALRDGIPPDSPAPGIATNTLAYIDGHGGRPAAAMDRMAGFVESPMVDLLDPAEVVTFLATAGGWAAAADDAERGRQLCERAIEVARESRVPSSLASALYSYGYAMERIDPEGAIAAIDEALALVRSGATPVILGYASYTVARLRARAGDRSGALEGLRDAVVYADRIGDTNQLNNSVIVSTVVFTELGEHEICAVIAGRALPLLEQYEERQSWEVDAGYAALDRTRAALGDEVYDRNMASGRTMSHDETVLYLRTELERLLAEVNDG
jgi:predicted ATPase/class 3 adenylate cyclase